MFRGQNFPAPELPCCADEEDGIVEMIRTSIKITVYLIVVFVIPLLSQNLAGTWIIKKQYYKGELLFNAPYMKYEFIPPYKWNVYSRKDFHEGEYDSKDGGSYAINGNKLGLSYWDSDNIDWGTYFIQGDTLLIIDFKYEEGLSRMIFKREMKLPDI